MALKKTLNSQDDLQHLSQIDEQIDLQDKTLDTENRALYEAILSRYDKVGRELVSLLSDKSVVGEEKRDILAMKKEFNARKKKFLEHFSEFAESDRLEAEAEKRAAEKAKKEVELFGKLDCAQPLTDEEKDVFRAHYRSLTSELQGQYLDRLKSALGQKTSATVKTGFKGILFELSRRALVIEQEKETLDSVERVINVSYLGYDRMEKSPLERDPVKMLGGDTNRGDIEFDIQGIQRGGVPFVYETKSNSRKMLGHDYGEGETVAIANQFLKYQQAAKEGKVAGVTVEVQGRIDYAFLAWVVGEKIEQIGPVPRVEIIYSLELPSGAEYRFVLKRPTDEKGNFLKGLQFENNDSNYTEEDSLVVAGIAQAVRDMSISHLLQDTNIDRETAIAEGLTMDDLEHPEKIVDVSIYNKFIALRKETVLRNLLEKGRNPKRADRIAPYDESATAETVMKTLVDYQTMLDANPALKAAKAIFVVPPDRFGDVVEAVMSRVTRIKVYELERLGSEDEKARSRKRLEIGYRGPEEGFPLDIVTIMHDVLKDINKKRPDQKPKSYDKPERFIHGRNVLTYLADKDRSFTEITTYDGKAKNFKKTTITGDKASMKDKLLDDFERDLHNENIRRSEKRLQDLLTQVKDFRQKEKVLTETEKREYAQVQRALSGYANGAKKSLEDAKKHLADLEEQKKAAIDPLNAQIGLIRAELIKASESDGKLVKREDIDLAQKTVRDQVKAASEGFNKPIQNARMGVLAAFKEVFARDWDLFTKREVKREEANSIKFIYVIDGEGNAIFEEEKIRGIADSSAAAHSELGSGRNIYAAGELSFTKGADGQWFLSEINNGSGHYRPEHGVLTYAKHKICEVLGINGHDPRIKLRHSLFRGLDIDGLAILEPET